MILTALYLVGDVEAEPLPDRAMPSDSELLVHRLLDHLRRRLVVTRHHVLVQRHGHELRRLGRHLERDHVDRFGDGHGA